MRKPFSRAALVTLLAGACLAYSCRKAVPSGTGASTSPKAATAIPSGTVEVTLTEYRIVMPESVPAGSIKLAVTNDGTSEHTIEIVGNGEAVNLGTPLQPGESRVMAVDLRPGRYRVYCPIADEEERGMRALLTVG